MSHHLDSQQLQHYIHQLWEDSIIPTLANYIAIPNKSPLFDANWQQHGYMDDAINLVSNWCQQHAAIGMQLEVIRLPGRTPLLYIDIPGSNSDTVLLYGHLDKQPEMQGWAPGFSPWQPVIKDGKLYGRGGADDGYAIFASLTAINALQQQQLPHARCVIIIECCEESGSYDLPFYIDHLQQRIGTPSLIICLDSGCGNYEQLWMTTSLRGNLVGELKVALLQEGVHSGNASGIVADTFRIIKSLLSRVEHELTGEILVTALKVAIPQQRLEQATLCAAVLGDKVFSEFPFIGHATATSQDLSQLVLKRTWEAALTVTGANGLPNISDAGNVLRPFTALKLSMRTPPTCDAPAAHQALATLLTQHPPYNASVTYQMHTSASGWNAPPLTPWLAHACETASQTMFGNTAVYMGEGGTIPFMGMLGGKFPAAQFMITGVLGPHSNAHGPNEFLHLAMAKKLTGSVAMVLAAHAMQAV